MRCELLLVAALGLATSACHAPASSRPAEEQTWQPDQVGTPAQRLALFDDLMAKTLRREAFSAIKYERLGGYDVEGEMRKHRAEIVSAQDDQALLFALRRLSNARRDTHLRVRPAAGFLEGVGLTPASVPLRFAPDFGEREHYSLFVADLDSAWFRAHPGARKPQLGDRLVAVWGRPLQEHVEWVEPYYRYSTPEFFWWKLGAGIGERVGRLPAGTHPSTPSFTFETRDGERYEITVSYEDKEKLVWDGHFEPRYPGFELAFRAETFDVYRCETRGALLLQWHEFGPRLVADIDNLMAFARDGGRLHEPVIIDATRAHGGSRGVYAVRHLVDRPFRTTFGNLRLSDAIPPFIEKMRRSVASGGNRDGGSPESMDGGRRVLSWLEEVVLEDLASGRDYTNATPFKLAHLPRDSDGMAQPATLHFDGPLVAFFAPNRGSHLDQFAAMLVDNQLAYTIGMPTGGYSNTWEWSETLTLPGPGPGTGRPLVEYMWSIGHTIRPNGEVLEGNPAEVDERVPLTTELAAGYHAHLLTRAFSYLDTAVQRGEESETVDAQKLNPVAGDR